MTAPSPTPMPTLPVYLFAGPTLHGLPAPVTGPLAGRGGARSAITLLPPAERGSITALTGAAEHRPSTIVIVDGRYGDVLAVGHREILTALDAGWRVWGVASMGAIRAAELSEHGMRGFGAVYRHFRDQMPPDDEVAVLHGPGPDHRPLTEALVDLRAFLRHLAAAGVLACDQADQVARALGRRWFGDRTTAALVDLCTDIAGPAAGHAIRARLGELPEHRVKTADLCTFLTEQPWQSR